MAPEAPTSSFALVLALLLLGVAPFADAHSAPLPGDPRFLALRDGWPQELTGTSVFAGGHVEGDPAGGDLAKTKRFCWSAAGSGRVGASDACWRHEEDPGQATGGGPAMEGEVVLGAVVMGRPFCILMIDDSGAHYPCCAFVEPSAFWGRHSIPCGPPEPTLLP